jgi:type IV pilus assembly protein PilC
MPDYRFRAVNAAGHITQGAMAAPDAAQVTLRLQDAGYELLSLAHARQPWWRLPSAPDPAALQLVFTHLAALTEAGVPLALALKDAAATAPLGLLRTALDDIGQRLDIGEPFVVACAAHPRVFAPSLSAVLQAGMASGNPAQAFAQACKHLAWQQEFAALLRRALRYPVFLVALTTAVISFMLLYVVPQLTAFLQAQTIALPWHSRALIWLAEHCALLWWVLPLVGGLAYGGLVLARREWPHVRLWSDGCALRLPVLGTLLQQKDMAGFLHHLAVLLGGGVPLLTALAAARGALRNQALQAQAADMVARITAGQDLATAWQHMPAFGGLVARRVQIGLQSDTLVEQLQAASDACDAAVIARSKQLIGTLEPALTLLVGLMLAWIVLAVLAPLYQSLATLGVAGAN